MSHVDEHGNRPFELRDRILGGATGVLGYQLATTQGGTPPVSQIAGLGILASIGLINVKHLPEDMQQGMALVSPATAVVIGDPLAALSPLYGLGRLLGVIQ